MESPKLREKREKEKELSAIMINSNDRSLVLENPCYASRETTNNRARSRSKHGERVNS